MFVYQYMEKVKVELEFYFVVEDCIFQQNIYTGMKTVMARLDKSV